MIGEQPQHFTFALYRISKMQPDQHSQTNPNYTLALNGLSPPQIQPHHCRHHPGFHSSPRAFSAIKEFHNPFSGIKKETSSLMITSTFPQGDPFVPLQARPQQANDYHPSKPPKFSPIHKSLALGTEPWTVAKKGRSSTPRDMK